MDTLNSEPITQPRSESLANIFNEKPNDDFISAKTRVYPSLGNPTWGVQDFASQTIPTNMDQSTVYLLKPERSKPSINFSSVEGLATSMMEHIRDTRPEIGEGGYVDLAISRRGEADDPETQFDIELILASNKDFDTRREILKNLTDGITVNSDGSSLFMTDDVIESTVIQKQGLRERIKNHLGLGKIKFG
ncbi:MAG TPA: hypothetical protein VL401_02720 [Alphaproteobacteria bacterium]|jgi:hypothetical protein|nr:hypothetical protein [Alphaproteobacteria bacterium]